MKHRIVIRWTIVLLSLFLANSMKAQLTGIVVDSETGEELPAVRISYSNKSIITITNLDGEFSIERHNGETLTFSMVGYDTYTLDVTAQTVSPVTVSLHPQMTELKSVEVSSKGTKYKKKNNPAVELMRRIIAANKKDNLKANDYYEFYKYQKLTLAKNNVKQAYIDSLRLVGSKEWMTDQVELCPLNGKLILPVQINETVIRSLYRKSTDSEKNYILGETKRGLMSQMSTMGDMFNAIVAECFVDVDIYQNQIHFLDKGFTSPIGNTAIGFYHFYISDTLMVGNDRCFDIYFSPANHQDIGFSGHLYALADSSLHIRRVELSLPKESGINFVDNMNIFQEFIQLPNGQWVIDSEDMLVDMSFSKYFKNSVVIQRTKYSDYSFQSLPGSLFRKGSKTVTEPESGSRDNAFWDKFRTLELTKSESNVDKYVNSMMNRKGWKGVFKTAKIIADDYIETSFRDSVKSKFDFGPLTTLVGKNTVDGWRVKLSGRTNTALSQHWFWRGNIAYGFDTKNVYYMSEFAYSFNKKINQPWEFPIRQIAVSSTYGIMTPYDKFLLTTNDNWITSIHVIKLDKYYIYNTQKAEFKYETRGGLCLTAGFKAEAMEGAAAMEFTRLDGTAVTDVRTSELFLGLRFAPGETYLNTKQRRYPLNSNAPVFYLYHSFGPNNFLGSQYKTNYTEISFQKRLWLKSWGKMDFYIAGKSQWNKVPLPLLIMPTLNLSWITQHDSHTFELMNNMEFLTDRTLQWQYLWDLNGKIFNRIPGIKKLGLREVIIFRGLWGHLSDKNDPDKHLTTDNILLKFPTGCENRLGKKPYMEVSAGIHNILKLFEVDYVYRLTYRDLDTARGMYRRKANTRSWGGIRVGLNFAF